VPERADASALPYGTVGLEDVSTDYSVLTDPELERQGERHRRQVSAEFLSEASRVLSSSLDYEATLRAVRATSGISR